MIWSKFFIPTLREVPQEAETVSHQLLLRAGLIRMVMAGVYSYLPLGLRALNNIEKIIREEMDSRGASELLLPALQSQELWIKSGRDEVIGEVMFRFSDRRGRNLCLGPTHEEVITELIKSHVSSYKQLPFLLYQIQTKFRDEIRPRFGLIRGCEFIMKDAYSFDVDAAGLDKNYNLMYEAYSAIFNRCGLKFFAVEADSGVMGGRFSHEFMVPASSGEDSVLVCNNCQKAYPFAQDAPMPQCSDCSGNLEKTSTIEVGHIFKLGTKYSSALNANFAAADGKMNPMVMGCYGIGVSRLIPTIIEQNHDANGIIWPFEISPFKVIVVPLDMSDSRIKEASFAVYEELNKKGIDTILDDRDERAGVKFKDADLVGVPVQIIIGKEYVNKNLMELKKRRAGEKITVAPGDILENTLRCLSSADV